MSLPDVSRIASAPAELLRAFGKHLASIGLSLAATNRATERSAAVPRPHRRPIRQVHLRREATPVARALRMLAFSDPVSAEEARATFGPLLADLLELGIVVQRPDDGTVVSPFVFSLFDDRYFLADDLQNGADAVMGVGETTVALCRAALPRHSVRRVLDLGCGAGAVAFMLARAAKHVIATDVNDRALVLTRANAAINGISNVEVRKGSLFEPVAGETFDIVVTQPPFISQPSGTGEAQFLYGGRRGDELALEILKHVVDHLSAPSGRAVMLVSWPEVAGDPLLDRVRTAVGRDDAHILVLEGPAVSLDLHATSYAAGMHPSLDEEFDVATMRWLSHLENQRIDAILPSIVIVQPSAGARAVAEVIPTEPFACIAVTATRIDRILAARAVAADDERLLASRLRVPADTVLAQEQIGPGAEVPSKIAARFSPTALARPLEMTLHMLIVITMVHESDDVRTGIGRFAEATDTSIDEALATALPAIRSSLLYGMLELADA